MQTVGTIKESAKGNGALVRFASNLTRVRCYILLAERTASPTELAPIVKKDVGNVAYHCRRLEKLGIIEQVGRRQVRGAIENFYRAIERPYIDAEEWNRLTPEERAFISRMILQMVVADVSVADDAGSFDSRLDRSMFRFPIVLDDEGFAELAAIHTRLYDETFEVWQRSLKRQGESGEKGIRTMAIWMMFEQASADYTPAAEPNARNA
jgi:hypothetical protein